MSLTDFWLLAIPIFIFGAAVGYGLAGREFRQMKDIAERALAVVEIMQGRRGKDRT